MLTGDQLLELHANLTEVQGELLEILRGHMEEAKGHESKQKSVQKHWQEFTVSLEQNLGVLSTNTTSLLRELFSGLLRLQSFTRDSTRLVAEELGTLDQEVRIIRGEIGLLNTDIDNLGNNGVARIEKLSEITQQQVMLVRDLISRV